MDDDNIDYYPRKHIPAHQASDRGAYRKAENQTWQALHEADLADIPHTFSRDHDIVTVRINGHPIDFYSRRNRWNHRGQKQSYNGDIAQFFEYCRKLLTA